MSTSSWPLARLGSELVACRVAPAADHLTAVAARDGARQLAVVVTHFRNDRPDNGGAAQPVKLELDVPWSDGTRAELRHWRIDAAHSNAYSEFIRLGRPKAPTADQIAQIKRRMGLEPLQPPRPVVIQGRIELAFELPCNGLSLVELVRPD